MVGSLLEKAGGKSLVIHGDNVYLRPLTLDDCNEEYLGWLNDPEVNKYSGRKGRVFTNHDMTSYVEAVNVSETSLMLGMFTKEENKHIGNVLLDKYDSVAKIADISNMIGNKEYWAKGVVIDVDKHLIHFGFKHLKMHKFTIGNIAPHRAATFMSSQLGFKKEALLKKHTLIGGKYYDIITFGLFADEFYAKFPNMENKEVLKP